MINLHSDLSPTLHEAPRPAPVAAPSIYSPDNLIQSPEVEWLCLALAPRGLGRGARAPCK